MIYTDTSQPPYLWLYQKLGNILIWIVDGDYARAHIDPNFTNFAQEYVSHYVPHNVWWIDKDVDVDEIPFFVDHLLKEHALMAKGMPYAKALAIADRYERRERQRSHNATAPEGEKFHHPDISRAICGVWGHTSDDITVEVANGELLRQISGDLSWTEGGHDKVYDFIPPKTVLIEDAIYNDLSERDFTLLHELFERREMAYYKKPYKVAHAMALRLEQYYRKHTNELPEALKALGWR